MAGGAEFVDGAHSRSAPTPTVLQPAILLDPPADARISREEVFGPVVCAYPYARIDDAIEAANALPVASQASLVTNDFETEFPAERLAGSAVMINDHTAFRSDWMPFAGHRQSGYGVGGIPATLRDMTTEKMIVFRL